MANAEMNFAQKYNKMHLLGVQATRTRSQHNACSEKMEAHLFLTYKDCTCKTMHWTPIGFDRCCQILISRRMRSLSYRLSSHWCCQRLHYKISKNENSRTNNLFARIFGQMNATEVLTAVRSLHNRFIYSFSGLKCMKHNLMIHRIL